MYLKDFSYPAEFIEITNRGLLDFDPWVIMEGEYLVLRFEGVRERYPDRKLVPFARRLDNDDIACWEEGHGEKVFIVHDFASAGWEDRKEYDNFWQWFKQAVDDMILYINTR